MKKLIIAFASLILMINYSAKSQTGSLQGKVLNTKTSEYIAYANIVIESGGKKIGGTNTDIDGKYRISPLPAGKYDIKISTVGYKPNMITNIIINPDMITFQNIYMEPTTEVLDEFVITEYAVPLITRDRTSSGSTVTSSEIRKIPARSAESVAVTVGGVFSADGEMGSVRGCRAEGTVYYIDGMRVIGNSSIPHGAIDQVTIITGGTPAQYENNSDADNSSKQNPSILINQAPELINSNYIPIVNDDYLTAVDDYIIEEEEPQNYNFAILTASELNDFSKWDLWKDVKENELKYFQSVWKISPQMRYSVLVKSSNDRPVVDATVLLINDDDNLIWSAKTDNTGKAELWADMFSESENKDLKLVVEYNNKEYVNKKPDLFNKGINVFKIPTECNNPNQIDIAFVVDATGSMGDEIAFLKSDLIDIIQKTKESIPDVTINLGSVFYRCFGNSYVTKSTQLSDNINKVVSFIRDQNAGEGGDEVVEEALKVAVDNLNWSPTARARLLFFVLDEQPLQNPNVLKKLHTYIQKAAQKGIRVIPVIASGETQSNAFSLEYLMRSMALATNGTYVFLTDHSNIGDAHATPNTDQYDVELLNTLLKRIIYKFCYIPKCDEALNSDEITDTTCFSNSPIIAHEIINASKSKAQQEPKEKIKDFTSASITDTIAQDNISVEENFSTNNTDAIPTINIVNIKFYPNPTSGKISVEIKGKIDALYLSDFSGKLISKYNISEESKIEIDLSNYSSGIYLLKFYDNTKWYQGKVVLTH